MAKVPVEPDVQQLARAIAALPRRQQEELWAVLATFEEQNDRGAIESLRESEDDVKAGRLYSLDEVFGVAAA